MTNKVFPNDQFFELVEEELATVERVRIVVRGNSMYPLLRDGMDEVSLRRLSANESVRTGEIYLFRSGGRYVLHRCISADEARFKFRGDNAINSESCTREEVRAVVEQVFRKGGNGCSQVSYHSAYWTLRSLLHRFRCRTLSLIYRLCITK